MKIAIITMPWHLGKRSSGMGTGPEALLKAGVVERLRELGHEVVGPWSAELSEAEQKEYGAWHKVGLANRHLAELVYKARSEGYFPLVLESDCTSALGVLAGLQHSSPASRLGMLWFDAHGDANTPETTLSGYIFGMPVAIAAGLCLEHVRLKAGLEGSLAPRNILLLGVRDLDPLEKELVVENGIGMLPGEAVAQLDEKFSGEVERVRDAVEQLYIHVDLDVLDPQYFPAADFPTPHGLEPKQLGQALHSLLADTKVGALGFSALNPEKEQDGKSVASALEVISGALA
ncbi:MAG: arginase family protein [Chloroflexi bacterium]|nr:arginase family protein [Chloroflexota bacterium]